MPIAKINGMDIYYEDRGQGFPLVFSHEFCGDYRSWDAQVRYFARRYRVITYNNRGYPPSSVPQDASAYTHDELIDDLYQLLRHLGIEQAHIAGLATGGNVVLNFGIRHPEVARSLVVAGAGAGTVGREQFLAQAKINADAIESEGMEALVKQMLVAPQRQALRLKDPRGWDVFLDEIRTFSPLGAAHVMRVALMGRTPLFELENEIEALSMPILVMVGDQDTPARETSAFVAQHAPHAGLCVLPKCGHTLNIEEPGAFHYHVSEFLAAVDNGRWGGWSAA